jgi:hypothetical protein
VASGPARYFLRAASVTALLILIAACARPVGDFGRAAPSFTHDELMPAVGAARADAAGEPVSDFNRTDQEDEMHNRVWRFLIAPHAKDWFFDVAVELKRTRISTASDTRFRKDRYYDWLHETKYESSRIRYATITEDAKMDIATVPETFVSICEVIEIDRQRAIALDGVGPIEVSVAENVAARKYENDQAIGWFVRALRYRFDSYTYALEHLLVETPHEEARETDVQLTILEGYVRRAERGDFCGDGRYDDGIGRVEIPSRYEVVLPVDPEDALPPK